jgi:transposase
MPLRATAITLTTEEHKRLTAWVRAGTTPQRLARRARLILGAAAGQSNRALAQQERVSRAMVQRWRARFLTAHEERRHGAHATPHTTRCAGLQDRPRSGRPPTIRPTTRALVVAVACERPAARAAPLSRYSVRDLTTQVAGLVPDGATPPSRSTVWRVLDCAALRPWRHHPWLFPRDPHFLEKAGRVLDLYARLWEGQPLGPDEFVLSTDEKTSIQARVRRHATLPPSPHQATRVEHEYQRGGALQYLAAWDVHRATVFGRCEPRTGKAPFARLVDHVMAQEPYRSARRVFWVADNGSSHRGEAAASALTTHHPTAMLIHTPVHASWLNQIEIYFSILQRKVLTPNDFADLSAVESRLHAFAQYYSARTLPFDWRFTRHDLQQRMRALAHDDRRVPPLATAA